MSQPPLQNIPVRTVVGKQIRKVFSSGPLLGDTDFAALEALTLVQIAKR